LYFATGCVAPEQGYDPRHDYPNWPSKMVFFGSALNNTSAITSLALGTSILGKHFTLNQNGEMPMC
jgi:hypothetical protein